MRIPAVKAQPRGNARNVVFYELAGALSHVDSFDFKENESHAERLRRPQDIHRIYVPHFLFPRMVKVLDKIAMSGRSSATKKCICAVNITCRRAGS